MKSNGGALYYFTLAMTAVYAGLGIYIMLSDSIENLLPGNKKFIIGGLLLFYAAYRAHRLYRINKSMGEGEE